MDKITYLNNCIARLEELVMQELAWQGTWKVDMVGIDLTLAIHKTVLPDIDSRPGPSPYLEELVAKGKLGFKSGEGFRKWTPEQQAELRMKVLQHLKKSRDT